MEVAALCIRLMTSVLFLLCASDQTVDSVSLRVDPNKQQFFQYDSPTFHCEGAAAEWRLLHRSKGEKRSCTGKAASTPCTITNVYPGDSGQYWCKAGEENSNRITITVTGGAVILESPALPVMEGEAVTLSCRHKTTSPRLTAAFFKDGVLVRNSSTGEMMIGNVSRFDEGLYKCSIFGAGESAESWLSVRGVHRQPTCSSPVPWIAVAVSLMALLLVVGLRHLGKGCWQRVMLYLSTQTPGSVSAEDPTASVEAGAAEADKVTYSVVRKVKKKNTDEDASGSGATYYTLGLDETQQQELGGSGIAATRHPIQLHPTDPFYSTIQPVAE